MRRTSVRDLHINTSELVREAEQGGVIVIERRGQPVAELRPLSAPKRVSPEKLAHIIASVSKARTRMRPGTDSTVTISEDRDR